MVAVSDAPPKPAPKPPRGLQARGRRFWTAVAAECDVTPDETELLTETARTLDCCERLQASDPDGAALRQCRSLLTRMLSALDLPESGVATPAQVRSRKANAARWANPPSGAAVSDAASAAATARWHGRRVPEPSDGFLAEFMEKRRSQAYGDSA